MNQHYLKSDFYCMIKELLHQLCVDWRKYIFSDELPVPLTMSTDGLQIKLRYDGETTCNPQFIIYLFVKANNTRVKEISFGNFASGYSKNLLSGEQKNLMTGVSTSSTSNFFIARIFHYLFWTIMYYKKLKQFYYW